jgi:hypothetical protein
MIEAEGSNASVVSYAEKNGEIDFGFLPKSLIMQCRSLVESFHELHGYNCLPDLLWKAKLGPFIETHPELRQLLKQASTTRSAKKSNEGFATIATTILSLEILYSGFAGWRTLHPQAALRAGAILKRDAGADHMPLMEFYLYPPKYINSAVIAALSPLATHKAAGAGIHRNSTSNFGYLDPSQPSMDGGLPHSRIVPPA